MIPLTYDAHVAPHQRALECHVLACGHCRDKPDRRCPRGHVLSRRHALAVDEYVTRWREEQAAARAREEAERAA